MSVVVYCCEETEWWDPPGLYGRTGVARTMLSVKIMKTIHFTIKKPKPRNAVAVAARNRKAGVHQDRRKRRKACHLRKAILAETVAALDRLGEK